MCSPFGAHFSVTLTKALTLEFFLSHIFTILYIQCGTNFAKQPTVCLFIPSFYQRKYLIIIMAILCYGHLSYAIWYFLSEVK